VGWRRQVGPLPRLGCRLGAGLRLLLLQGIILVSRIVVDRPVIGGLLLVGRLLIRDERRVIGYSDAKLQFFLLRLIWALHQ